MITICKTLDLETFALRAKNIYKQQSIERKLKALREYCRYIEENKLEPGIESLNKWLDELVKKGLSNNTVSTHAYSVLSYFDLMMIKIDDRLLKTTRRRIPRPTRGPVDFLTDEEVARLIRNTASPIHKLIYALCYTYARRLGEVLSLTWEDIDLENNKIRFRILKKKTEEHAVYELEQWIKDMILKYQKYLGKKRLFEISPRTVEAAFKKDCERAGIQPNGRKLRIHMLRHSRITSLRNMGIPLDLISKYLARHSSYDITLAFYRGVTEEEIAKIPKAESVLKLTS